MESLTESYFNVICCNVWNVWNVTQKNIIIVCHIGTNEKRILN